LGVTSLATYSADSVANAIRFVHDQGLDFAIVDTRLGNEATGDIAAHLVVKDVKFVMLDEGGNFEKRAGNGASHVLQKPVYAAEIIDCVRRFLPTFAL
jgi:ActR/RegA family two-component response regulator